MDLLGTPIRSIVVVFPLSLAETVLVFHCDAVLSTFEAAQGVKVVNVSFLQKMAVQYEIRFWLGKCIFCQLFLKDSGLFEHAQKVAVVAQ